MELTKAIHLSQDGMEHWFGLVTKRNALLNCKGVIPRMKPKFVSCNFENKEVVYAYPTLDWELNPLGVVNGGIINTALDSTLGVLCHYFVNPQVVTTVQMTCTYHKPVFVGEDFYVKATIDFLGRSLLVVRGEVWTKNNTILATTATATFKALRERATNPLVEIKTER